MNLSQYTNNRDKAIALIEAGDATKESLLEALGINDKSLASVFAQLRLMGYYPFKNENGVYSFISKEEFEAAKAVRASKAPAKTLSYEEQLERAQKRETKAATASTNAKAKYEASPTRENHLRMIIADAELELASVLLGQLEERNPENAPSRDGVELEFSGSEEDCRTPEQADVL